MDIMLGNMPQAFFGNIIRHNLLIIRFKQNEDAFPGWASQPPSIHCQAFSLTYGSY
jgi:hypothetical protein